MTVEYGNQSGYPGPRGELMLHPVDQSRSDMTAALVNAKPCPKCGGHPDYNEAMASPGGGEYRGYNVQCYACGIRGPMGNPVEAVAGWNDLDQIIQIATYVDGAAAYQLIRSDGGYEVGDAGWFRGYAAIPGDPVYDPLPRPANRRAALRKEAARLANRAARKARKATR